MKRKKSAIKALVRDAGFIAAITVVNKCFANKEKPFVQRDMDDESLNRKLTMVSLIYHALGVFYND